MPTPNRAHIESSLDRIRATAHAMLNQCQTTCAWHDPRAMVPRASELLDQLCGIEACCRLLRSHLSELAPERAKEQQADRVSAKTDPSLWTAGDLSSAILRGLDKGDPRAELMAKLGMLGGRK